MENEGVHLASRSGAARGQHAPDWWLFLSKFLLQGRAIAAFAPSSRFLARALVRALDFPPAGCVVELGAGTGPITAQLLARKPLTCRALIVERDIDFCRRLRRRFPQADIACADAADLERLLAERGIDRFDHCVSGLPLPSFAPDRRNQLLEVITRRLAPAGLFLQLTHMPWVYYTLYQRYFASVEFQMIWRNLPPGGFYVCRRPRA